MASDIWQYWQNGKWKSRPFACGHKPENFNYCKILRQHRKRALVLSPQEQGDSQMA
jgi:hypothetical protein